MLHNRFNLPLSSCGYTELKKPRIKSLFGMAWSSIWYRYGSNSTNFNIFFRRLEAPPFSSIIDQLEGTESLLMTSWLSIWEMKLQRALATSFSFWILPVPQLPMTPKYNLLMNITTVLKSSFLKR